MIDTLLVQCLMCSRVSSQEFEVEEIDAPKTDAEFRRRQKPSHGYCSMCLCQSGEADEMVVTAIKHELDTKAEWKGSAPEMTAEQRGRYMRLEAQVRTERGEGSVDKR